MADSGASGSLSDVPAETVAPAPAPGVDTPVPEPAPVPEPVVEAPAAAPEPPPVVAVVDTAPETVTVFSLVPWGVKTLLDGEPYIIPPGVTPGVPGVAFRWWLESNADFDPVARGLISIGA